MPSATSTSSTGGASEAEKQSTLRHTNLDLHNGDLEEPSGRHSDDYGNAKIDAIQQRNPALRFLANLESRIDRFAKFEAMGVERVPEDQRKPPQILNVRIQASNCGRQRKFMPEAMWLL